MKDIKLESVIIEAKLNELSVEEQALIQQAKDVSQHSYAIYSKFQVGAALLLKNGKTVVGCNQENAAFPVTICAERSAIFAAGAQYPDQPVVALAIAAQTNGKFTDEPVSPCGSCRQVIIETETRFNHPVRLLLYGQRCVYVIESIRPLMPLTFYEF